MDNINLKSKKTIGIICSIILVIIILLCIFVFRKDKVNVNTIILEKPTLNKISDAYKENKITTDEYVLYTAYSLFEPNKLSEEYKSSASSVAPNIMTLLAAHENDVSEETKEYIYDKIKMSNITIGKRDNSVSYNYNKVVPVSNKIAETEAKELDKYVISSNKNFVVWYTTSDGSNKADESIATNIAEKLEEYTQEYEKEYNIKYKFEPAYFDNLTEEDYKNYLKEVAPNDYETISKAMPVFISSLEQTNESENIMAFYVTMDPTKKYSGINKNGFSGALAGPYITINASLIDKENESEMNHSIAHELFHHFQNYICGDGTYKLCEVNNTGEELFEIETTAEWAAAKIVDYDNSDNTSIYLNNLDKRIDTIWPYSTQMFLMNYENTVENGKTKILDALGKHDGDTLGYLNSQASNMDEVMKNLAKNNLINSYEYNGFKIQGDKNFSLIKSSEVSEIINNENNVNEMAISYAYVNQPKDKYKFSNTSSNDKTYLTVMLVKKDNIKLTTANINGKDTKIQEFKDAKVLYSEKLTNDVILDFDKYKDDFIIFAFSNASIDSKSTYKIETTSEESNAKLEEQKEETKKDSDDEKENSSLSKYFDIYVDNKATNIGNFEMSNRAYVDINNFCKVTNLCEVKYTDDKLDKVSITSKIDVSGNTFTYTLINEKQQKKFDSTLTVGKINYDLSQLDVDVASCPTGKDGLGNDIPECNETSYYVPIRFIAQALGYNVNWSGDDPKRIDITTDLQDKLKEEFELEFVLSKEKVEIDEEVNSPIKIEDKLDLELNQKYYLYTVDKDGKRKYNSAISLLRGNEEDIKIVNEKEDDNMTYSSIEISNKSTATLALVTTVTIPSTSDSRAGIYPVIQMTGIK